MAEATSAAGAPTLLGIHHFTVRCTPGELEGVRAFYGEVLGMSVGPRPAFEFAGHWMYVGEVAVVHLAAVAREPDAGAGSRDEGSGFDHVSLHAANLDATRRRLQAGGVPFEELPVPGWPLRQIFLRDPVGSKIELTFDVAA